EVAEHTDLAGKVLLLRQMGYREVVLVGHSAGALIARHFVEDHPDSGVTKVIQVCAPNTGSPWAALDVVRSNQVPFLSSMTRSVRRKILAERMEQCIPPDLPFACIVGACRIGGDYIVVGKSQWSEELQRQGVPAYPLRVTHWDVMTNERSAELITSL